MTDIDGSMFKSCL